MLKLNNKKKKGNRIIISQKKINHLVPFPSPILQKYKNHSTKTHIFIYISYFDFFDKCFSNLDSILFQSFSVISNSSFRQTKS